LPFISITVNAKPLREDVEPRPVAAGFDVACGAGFDVAGAEGAAVVGAGVAPVAGAGAVGAGFDVVAGAPGLAGVCGCVAWAKTPAAQEMMKLSSNAVRMIEITSQVSRRDKRE
jgi:hypothetical protein